MIGAAVTKSLVAREGLVRISRIYYPDALKNCEMVASMSRKGNCWDNAVAESTFATIKIEALGDYIPTDTNELKRILFPCIEGVFNQHRLHSTLD